MLQDNDSTKKRNCFTSATLTSQICSMHSYTSQGQHLTAQMGINMLKLILNMFKYVYM